jgi:hypothetical protein
MAVGSCGRGGGAVFFGFRGFGRFIERAYSRERRGRRRATPAGRSLGEALTAAMTSLNRAVASPTAVSAAP